MNSSNGKVYLIGAGPGDPSLLTLKAFKIMTEVDVIAYDALISSEMITFLKSEFNAELIPIGYRGYHGTSLEYKMHPTVIEKSTNGKSVARLKAGDPFIFGRGVQECTDLISNEIEFEIIPGITSALGAAACCGFPLTAIGKSSAVTFVSGHNVKDDEKASLNWKGLANSNETLVIYMGSKKIKENFSKLVSFGMDAERPALYVGAATTSKQLIIEGTLDSLPGKIENVDPSLPALIIIGDVVKLRHELNL